MAQSAGAVALDIVMGKNTVTGVVQQAMSECQKVINDSSAGIGTKIGAIGTATQNIGGALLPVSTAVAGVGTGALKTAADFETSMSKVAAISGATGSDLDALTEKAKEMGAKTKFSASDSAEAFQYMAMAGWKTEDMLDGISGIMDLAAASGEDLGTTSDIVTDALTAFGLTAADSGHFADVLAAASSNANTNVSLMGETFKYVAPVAGSLGYTVEDMSTAIGLMANSGIKGSQAGTALRSTITRLAKPTDESAMAMEKLGISITNSDGTMKSFNEIMLDMRSSFAGLTEDEKASYAAMLGGQEAMSGLLAIVNASDEDFNKLSGAINDCDGSAGEMAATMQDNLNGKLTTLKSQLEGVAIQLGDILIPIVSEVVGVVSKVVDWFSKLDEGTQKTIVTIGLIVAAAGPFLIILGKVISSVGGIVTMFSKFTGVASAAAAPVASAGGAVGGLAKNALGLVAAGAGILLAAAGIGLLAYSAIQLAQAGPLAIGVMAGLVVAVAGMALGAAALAPALTAGAVGLIAFGAGMALIGVAVLTASAGMALLAMQLPIIAEYGLQASVNILALGGSLAVFSVGAVAGGAGAVVLGAGLTACAVGVLALSVAILALTVTMSANTVAVVANTVGFVANTVAVIAGTVAVVANTVAVLADTVAVVANTVGILALTVAILANTVTILALTVAILALTIAEVANTVAIVAMTVAYAAATIGIGLFAVGAGVAAVAISVLSGNTTAAANNMIGMFSNMLSGITSSVSGITSSIQSGFGSAINFITGLPAKAVGWGKDFIGGLVDGIKSMMGAVGDAVEGVADTITSFLHFSVPDEGPLTQYESWMPDFMQGLANGISSSKGLVTDELSDLTSDMSVNPTIQAPALRGVRGGSSESGSGDKLDMLIEYIRQLVDKDDDKPVQVTAPIYIAGDYIDDYIVDSGNRKTVRSGGRA